MRVYVSKPVEGRVNIRCDDRKGLTGDVWKLEGVAVEDIEAAMTPVVRAWETRRQNIKQAMKPKPA